MAGQKPLGADVLHYSIPTALGGLLHLLDEDRGPCVFLLHGNQIGRTQFATCQVGLNLATGRGNRGETSVSSRQETQHRTGAQAPTPSRLACHTSHGVLTFYYIIALSEYPGHQASTPCYFIV